MAKFRLKCARCHRTFRADSPRAMYCTDAHRQADYRDRKAEQDRHSRQVAAARPKAKPAALNQQVNDSPGYQPMLTPLQIKLMREVPFQGQLIKLYPILKMNGTQSLTSDGKPIWRTQDGRRVTLKE